MGWISAPGASTAGVTFVLSASNASLNWLPMGAMPVPSISGLIISLFGSRRARSAVVASSAMCFRRGLMKYTYTNAQHNRSSMVPPTAMPTIAPKWRGEPEDEVLLLVPFVGGEIATMFCARLPSQLHCEMVKFFRSKSAIRYASWKKVRPMVVGTVSFEGLRGKYRVLLVTRGALAVRSKAEYGKVILTVAVDPWGLNWKVMEGF